MSKKLARWIVEHRLGAFVFVVGCALFSLFLARRLKFEISWVNLFPDTTPEVISFRQVAHDIESSENLVVAISGPEAARDAFAYKVAAALKTNKYVASADAEVPRAYLGQRWLYSIDPNDLRRLSAAMHDSVETTRERANPFVEALDNDDPWAPTNKIAREIFNKEQSRWEFQGNNTQENVDQAHDNQDKSADITGELDRMLEPYKPESKDGKYRLVEVRPRATIFTLTSDYGTILDNMHASLEGLEKPEGVEWRISGFMLVALREYHIANDDMNNATLLSFGLVLLILLVAMRRVWILLLVAFTLVCGLLLSLGFTQIIFGRLNIISGFMLPVLLGLGVDFCIHFHVAYRAAMAGVTRDDDAGRKAAIVSVIQELLLPSAAAAFTTSLGFSALMLNEFKGVSEYGAIASLGLIMMFAVAFLVFPALLYWFDKSPRPIQSFFGKPPASTTVESSRTDRKRVKTIAIAVLVVVGAIMVVFISGVNKVSYYNDYRAMRGAFDAQTFHQYILDQTGGAMGGSLVLADNEAQARAVVDAATRVKNAQTSDAATNIKRIFSMTQLVPTDVDVHAAEIAKMDNALADLPLRKMKDEDKRAVESLRRFTNVSPPKAEDMPQYFKDRLRSPSGKWMVLLFAANELSTDDEFVTWTEHIDALRDIVAKQGPPPPIVDPANVGARLRLILRRTLNPMIFLASALVALVTLWAFKRVLPTIGVLVALAVGVVATFGAIPFFGMHLNLYNVVIVPSIVGIGIDNAVHIMHGFLETRDIRKTMATRGLACFLCTATTGVGYGALLIANHGGIRSLGQLAILGMFCIFLTTTLALPAVLALIERRIFKKPAR